MPSSAAPNTTVTRRLRGRSCNTASSSPGTNTSHHSDVVVGSVVSHRASFVAACKAALEALMRNHGYSRERAVATLLHELSSTAATILHTTAVARPSDTEIFKVMRLHNLGMEQAASALTVAHAVRHTAQQPHSSSGHSRSVNEALEELTRRMANIRPKPTTTTATELTARPASPLAVPVRIVAVQQTPSIKESTTKVSATATATRSKAFSKNKSKTASSTVTKGVKEQQQPRARADSVTEAVTSKLTAAAAAADSTKSGGGKPDGMVVAKTGGGGGNGKPPTTAARNSTNSSSSSGTAASTNKRSRNSSCSVDEADVAEQQQHCPSSPLATSSKRPRRTTSMSSNNTSSAS